MSYSFSVEGWQDFDGGRFVNDDEGDVEPDLENVQGVFVHAVNDDDPSDEHYFWTYVGEPFEEWEEWWVLVGAMMDMHGMSIS